MAHVNIANVAVNNNPAPYLSSFHFSVTFECLAPIKEEIEWKVIYVGSPGDDSYDQELDCFLIGPFNEPGVMQFEIELPHPNWSKIPTEDVLGVAALIHSASYQKQEFFRVGYFVYNNYEDQYLMENPYPLQIDKVSRLILVDKPQITKYNIDWNAKSAEKEKEVEENSTENASVATDEFNINMFIDYSGNDQQGEFDNRGFSDCNMLKPDNNIYQLKFTPGKDLFTSDNEFNNNNNRNSNCLYDNLYNDQHYFSQFDASEFLVKPNEKDGHMLMELDGRNCYFINGDSTGSGGNGME